MRRTAVLTRTLPTLAILCLAACGGGSGDSPVTEPGPLVPVIRASTFGVVPTSPDVSAALNALAEHIESIGGNCAVAFEPGSYTIDRKITVHYGDTDPATGRKGNESHAFVLRGVEHVSLDMRGTDWQIVGGYTTHYEAPSILGGARWEYPPGFLYLHDCDHVSAYGFHAKGGADSITRGDNEHGVPHSELGNHGVAFRGSRDCNVFDATIDDFTCDGISDDNWSRNGVFLQGERNSVHDVTIHRASRNGITVGDSRHFSCFRTTINDTGDAHYMAHSPVAGIDIEADHAPDPNDPLKPDEWAGDHYFSNVTVNSGTNALRTFVAYWTKNRNVTVESCEFNGRQGESGYSFYFFCPGAVMRNSYVRALLPQVGAHDGYHGTFTDNVFDIDFYSHPYGWLGIGESNKTGSVTFRRNVVNGVSGFKTAHIYCPNSDISDNAFHSGTGLATNWHVTVRAGLVNTTIDGNTFTTDRTAALLLLQGLDTNSTLGAGVSAQ